jgi:hypothetical protein
MVEISWKLIIHVWMSSACKKGGHLTISSKEIHKKVLKNLLLSVEIKQTFPIKSNQCPYLLMG